MSHPRIKWSENRQIVPGVHELVFVIADKIDGQWEFSERTAWEIDWYQITATPALTARAEAEVQRHGEDE